jgi:hypothetical protein
MVTQIFFKKNEMDNMITWIEMTYMRYQETG